jgi:hypothetical protein
MRRRRRGFHAGVKGRRRRGRRIRSYRQSRGGIRL